jgi:hypothetical protein
LTGSFSHSVCIATLIALPINNLAQFQELDPTCKLSHGDGKATFAAKTPLFVTLWVKAIEEF